MAKQVEGGGFLTPVLPSPPPSISPSSASKLPQTREHALRPGSSKESVFVGFVENRLQEISGRFERRNARDGTAKPAGSSGGYQYFSEIAKDLKGVVDTIWVSGTPSLQIPFFLNIADALLSYLRPFPFAPKATFELLGKLDVAFVSLLKGTDPESGDMLAGFETGRKITVTEQVRLQGIVERTRVLVVKISSGNEVQEETGEHELVSDSDMDMLSSDTINDHDDWDMDVARVYEKTLADLGDTLGDNSLAA